MASFNRVILIGHLVADPELKTTTSGISVTSFRIGVNRRFVKQGEQPQTDFIDIVCWRQLAEFVVRYFSKGKPILISGQLQTRSWTDNNNQKRYTTEVVADEATFVERKSGDETGAPGAMPMYGTPKADDSFVDLSADDELPF